MLRNFVAAGFAMVLLMGSAVSSFSQTDTMNKKKGQELAQRLCSNCHLVDNNKDAIANEVAPAFSKIAAFPGQTPERLAGKIIIPHPAMPKISLTRTEIRDIISYITSLNAEK